MTEISAAVRERVPRAAWVAWAVGLVAYAAAVFHRSSLGVAGVAAQERFGVGASTVSLFLVLQLIVYASLQVPVGVAVDRLGSRRVLVLGALTMAAGQLTLALATNVPTAIAARILVGAGDAMAFISVLRLVAVWFPARVTPMITQLTGILGLLGQVVAAYPLVALLHNVSWAATFAGAAGTGVLIALLVAVALKDAPPGTVLPTPTSLPQLRRHLAVTAREPGTRLGFFSHLTQFSGMVFGLLWGYPFLVVGQGLQPSAAAGLLTLLVLGSMVAAPLLGQLIARWPLRRSVLVFSVVAATALVWAVVLAWPGRAPLPLLVILVLVLSTNGPASAIGFDFARTANPVHRIGSANGFVNVGGFTAALLTVLAIGVILDAMTPGASTAYSLDAFRVAFLVQYVMWAIGLVGVLHYRRVLRSALADRGVIIAPLPSAMLHRLRGSSAYR